MRPRNSRPDNRTLNRPGVWLHLKPVSTPFLQKSGTQREMLHMAALLLWTVGKFLFVLHGLTGTTQTLNMDPFFDPPAKRAKKKNMFPTMNNMNATMRS